VPVVRRWLSSRVTRPRGLPVGEVTVLRSLRRSTHDCD
jgi:hypothetical protein